MSSESRLHPESGAALALAAIPRFGAGAIRSLIDRHGSATRALKTVMEDSRGLEAERHAQRAGHELPGDARTLVYGADGYPERLKRLARPPIVLWAAGPLPVDNSRSVAIVGTRGASAPGRELARQLASDLVDRGIRIVSGLADGIDEAAHLGALDAGGETAAVLGSGLDHVYPSVHRKLFADVRKRGCLLSEYQPLIPPASYQFPRRNRIIAALADAVLVVEAGRRSGALITAAHALEIGVEVLACPGPARAARSEGCHQLVKQGAGLVTEVADIVDALNWEWIPLTGCETKAGASAAAADPVGVAIRARLAGGPAGLEDLAALADDTAQAASILGRLEAAGLIQAVPGARFQLTR